MTSLPIRPVSPDEFPTFHDTLALAFGNAPDEEEVERERELIEFDRTLAALDDDEIVATAAAYSFDMTVPGGSLPTAGVTWVSVAPTHRRRGVLTGLMRRQLDDIHEAGREPIAALWASEPAIYGRFGYGMASTEVHLTLRRGAGALRTVPGTDELRVRLLDPEEALPLVLPVYEHDRARRPGMFALSPAWQRMTVYLPDRLRAGGTPVRTVVAEDDGGVRAYANYTGKSAWSSGRPDGTVTVRAMHGRDPAAYAAVWSYLLNLDLVERVTLSQRPVDDPLVSMLVDLRRAEARLSDALHVRVVDVGAALSARTYAAPVDVVVDVRDGGAPWNAGRWRLSGDATGGRCERSTSAPDITLDVRELGATYLGGTSLAALADAGFVDEHTAGAVGALSVSLRHEPAPWCPWIF